MGNASFLNAGKVKEFASEMVRGGITEFVVDFEECIELDSTFMGKLAGIALRLREICSGSNGVRVIHVSAEHEKRMRELGLDTILKM